MKIRKISIEQLCEGMFIHELDIPWIKSPFLKHRRLIKSGNDVSLLRKAGVRQLVIDLTRGGDIRHESAVGGEPNPGSEATKIEASGPIDKPAQPANGPSEQNHSEPLSDLSKELQIAKLLRSRIGNLIDDLNARVKQGRPLSMEQIGPVIDEARKSLGRNDQALLTVLHLRRQDVRLSDHGFGVFSVVLPLAMHLGLGDDDVNDLGMAALLHDSGWSRLPVHLLGKKQVYTGAELRLIHQHPAIAENALYKNGGFPQSVIDMVRQHHEHPDGSGYPDGLTHKQMNPMIGVLQLADVYDEYIHGLANRPGMLPANALKLIYQAAKKGLYNETIVSALVHVMGIYPLTSAVRLSNGEKGVVVEIDKQNALLPKVRIVYLNNGEPCDAEQVIDLAQRDGEVKIMEVIDPLDRKEDPLGLLSVTEV